jgi:1-phosphofructokinase family hexose kinase
VIVTVTPNPALDVTYDVEALVPHASHRVLGIREVAGGKGVNVASVLALMGAPVLATGLVGGVAGARIRADLDERGVPHDFRTASAPSRRTVTIVARDDGAATAFNEPGDAWTRDDRDTLADHLRRVLAERRPSVLVASGSVPPGFGTDEYAELVRLGHELGSRVVLDASGEGLLGGLTAGPDVVKPNLDELREVTGLADPVDGAKALQDKGARNVVVSMGGEGLLVVRESGSVLRGRLEQPLRGNATGAGDAAVAAVAHGLAADHSWPEVVRAAVAWSAAAVLQPVAGAVAADDVARLAGSVRLDGSLDEEDD